MIYEAWIPNNRPRHVSPALAAHNWMRACLLAETRARAAEQRAAKAERETRHLHAACRMIHADRETLRRELETLRRENERLRAEGKALRQMYLLGLSTAPERRAAVPM
jgi:predicted RNase H-like nuclease (RuvC/YqgF family)